MVNSNYEVYFGQEGYLKLILGDLITLMVAQVVQYIELSGPSFRLPDV